MIVAIEKTDGSALAHIGANDHRGRGELGARAASGEFDG
jgi:hypothetical protein